MICVYAPDCTDYSANGLGAVAPAKCEVTETLNGEWELVLTHPIDSAGKWRLLAEDNILRVPVPASPTPAIRQYTERQGEGAIKCTTSRVNLRTHADMSKPTICMVPGGTDIVILTDNVNTYWAEVVIPDGRRGYMSKLYMTDSPTPAPTPEDAVNAVVESRLLRDQPFRIYRVVPDMDKVTVYARHLFYDLMDNMIRSYTPPTGASGAQAATGVFGACLSAHDFTLHSDLVSTAEEVSFQNVNPVDAIFAENGIIEKYGGEIARDWYDVYLTERIGRDTAVTIRQGRNCLGVSYDVDCTNVVTRIMPTGETKDGDMVYLDDVYVDSPHIGDYPHPKWIHLPVQGAKVGEDGLTLAAVKQKLLEAAQAEFDKGCDLPTVTLDVDFICLENTEEMNAYAPLTALYLGDAARVRVQKIGVDVSMRMTQYTYDCLLKRYTQVTLGTVADTAEGNTITSRQLPDGVVGGAKLAIGSVNAGHLAPESVTAGKLAAGAIAAGSAVIADAAITRAQIADAAIGTAQIDDAAITSAKITDAAITRAKIDNAAIGSAQIDDAAITSAKIGSAAIGTAQIDDAAITSAKIADAAIGTAKIEDAAITSAKIADAAIGTAQIEDAAITSAKIGSAAVGTAKIDDAAITSAKIADAAVGSAKIANAAITRAKIQSAAIGTAQIETGAITTALIGTGAITTALIGTGAVETAQIADGSITDAKIVSLTANKLTAGTIDASVITVSNLTADNITAGTLNGQRIPVLGTDKLADGAVTGDKVAENAVTADKLVSGAVTTDKLAANAVTSNHIAANAVTAGKIASGAIEAAHIRAGAIQTTHLSSGVGSSLDISSNDAITARVTKTDLDALIAVETVAKCDIPAQTLIAGTDAGYAPIAAREPLDMDKPLLHSESSASAGNTVAGYTTKSGCAVDLTGEAGKTLFLRGTMDGKQFVPGSSQLDSLKIAGNSVQQTYTGKNLLDIPDIAAGDVDLNVIACSIGQAATLSFTNNSLSVPSALWLIRIGYQSGSYEYVFTTDVTATGRYIRTFNVSPENPIIQIYARNTNVTSGGWTHIQIEPGTAATAYEPYCGGIPAPNPGYPQTIRSVGTLVTEGEHAGEYAVTVRCAHGDDVITRTAYLDAPLRKGDEIDIAKGKLIRRRGAIESYAGETVGDTWISTTGELSTGATVEYALATPVETDITAADIPAYPGTTIVTVDGDVQPTDIVAENVVFTCDAPTTDDGLIYMALGQMTDTDAFTLTQEHPLYRYTGDSLKMFAENARSVETSHIRIESDKLEIKSGGSMEIKSGSDMTIDAGGDFSLKGGAASGEYLGISSTDDTTIFTGADDATGTGAKFSLSKQGEARMRDARVEGEVEVNGSLTLGDGVEVSFRDDAARMNFLRAMANGDALPYGMGGTGANSRADAMGNLGMIVGMDEPGNVTAQNIGDRYLLVKPGTTTAGNTATLARSGYNYQKVSQQRRLKTVNAYTFLSGNPENLPSNSTMYSSWSDTSTEYGALSATDAAYCHEASGTVSGSYSGSSSSTTGSGTTSGCVWRRTTTTNYEYRTYTRLVYRAVLPAPTAGTTDADIKSLSVKTALLTLTTNALESGTYALALADSADGQTGKTQFAITTGTGTVSFNLLDSVADLYAGTKYLAVERSGSSSSAITVTAAALALTYYSGARRTEEYVWNGSAWRPLALGTEYFFDETSDATVPTGSDIFTVPITDGHESAQYEFEFLGKANANSTTNFILCLNNDNTYSNYRSRVTYGSSVYSERARIGNTGATATPTFARGTITVIGGYVVITGQGMWASYNTAYSVVYGDGTTELTAINIRVEGSAAGIGCRMKVKRK